MEVINTITTNNLQKNQEIEYKIHIRDGTEYVKPKGMLALRSKNQIRDFKIKARSILGF